MNPNPPRVLLVEDDPVSAAFLRDAATALPARVDVAGSMAEAMELAANCSHDLYLVDANLPDGRGETLLQQLNMLQRMFQGTRKIGQCREPDSGRAACQRVRQRHRAVRQRR